MCQNSCSVVLYMEDLYVVPCFLNWTRLLRLFESGYAIYGLNVSFRFPMQNA